MSWQKAILTSTGLIIVFLAWILRYQITSVENGIIHRFDRWTGEVVLLVNGQVYDPNARHDMLDYQIRNVIHQVCQGEALYPSTKFKELREGNPSYKSYDDESFLNAIADKVKMTVEDIKKKIGYEK